MISKKIKIKPLNVKARVEKDELDPDHFRVFNLKPDWDEVIVIVPKQHHDSINKLKNPLHATVEEILG